jgi:GT2 family glycosyltransferase
VVIATLNRPEYLAGVLRDLYHQAPEDVEVLVVDQSPLEVTEEVDVFVGALEDGRFGYTFTKQRSLPNARNLGIERTSAPIILFLDDDVRLLPGLVEAHRSAYDDPRVGGVVGRIIERRVLPNARSTVNRVGFGGRVITNLWGTERKEVQALKGANMSVRREALEHTGGFDRNYRGTALLEDADIAERIRGAGWRLWFEPKAEVIHLSASDGGVRQLDDVRTEQWRFHNTGYYMRRHRGTWSWPSLVLTFAAIAVIRAVRWRRPSAFWQLMRALGEGWRLAADPPDIDILESSA